eukprot:Ihof_evm3s137 gene=Ihof_evmTU3s137
MHNLHNLLPRQNTSALGTKTKDNESNRTGRENQLQHDTLELSLERMDVDIDLSNNMFGLPSFPNSGLTNYDLTSTTNSVVDMLEYLDPILTPSPVLDPSWALPQAQHQAQPQSQQLPLPMLTRSQSNARFEEPNFEGPYHFNISFVTKTESGGKSDAKGATWLYGSQRDLLYVTMNTTVPINLTIEGNPPADANVRVKVVYANPEDYMERVVRCPTHADRKEQATKPFPDQIIRVDHLAATNELDRLNHYSVLIPYSKLKSRPQLRLRYLCYSSCVASINKRPVSTVIILEDASGRLLGQRSVSTKICACPGRDLKKDNPITAEKDKWKNNRNVKGQQTNDIDPHPSRTTFVNPKNEILQSTKSIVQDNNNMYTVNRTIRGRANFEMINKIIDSLNLMDNLQNDSINPNHSSVDPPALHRQFNLRDMCPTLALIPPPIIQNHKTKEQRMVSREKTPTIESDEEEIVRDTKPTKKFKQGSPFSPPGPSLQKTNSFSRMQ